MKFSSSILRGMAPGASKRCQHQSTLGGLTGQSTKRRGQWVLLQDGS